MRHSNRRILTVIATVAWAGLLWLTNRAEVGSSTRSEVPSKPALKKHYVTPTELVACGDMADRSLGSFSAIAHDGAKFTWPGQGRARPLVLLFIKRDCPCSVEFEPFFHRLEQRYRDIADFVGVIDADANQARAYAEANQVPYRVLADPERTIITRFEARNGGYVALLKSGGEVDTLWPGCSVEMMRELGRHIAVLGAVTERPVDVSGMPQVLTTGCPFSS
jgi:peroxiredoxin